MRVSTASGLAIVMMIAFEGGTAHSQQAQGQR